MTVERRQLKAFQRDAVDRLRKLYFLDDKTPPTLFLSAPTGSGKTFMTSTFISELSEKLMSKGVEHVFVWITLRPNLVAQSAEDLAKVAMTVELDGAISAGDLPNGCIAIVNWAKLQPKGKAVSKRRLIDVSEVSDGLYNVCAQLRQSGTEIFLIVDEAHEYATSKKSLSIIEQLQPSAKLFISATFDDNDFSALEPVRSRQQFINVELQKAIDSGLLRKGFCLPSQEDIESFLRSSVGQNLIYLNEFVMELALERRQELAGRYRSVQSGVNPLLVVQISNDVKKNAEESSKEQILAILKKLNVPEEKVAVWLSGDKNFDDAELRKPDNEFEILIAKQANTVGWDCPRAQVLMMFRDSQSSKFRLQLLGRIRRTSEGFHYEDDVLNHAYVFVPSPKNSIIADVALEQGSLNLDRILQRRPKKFREVQLVLRKEVVQKAEQAGIKKEQRLKIEEKLSTVVCSLSDTNALIHFFFASEDQEYLNEVLAFGSTVLVSDSGKGVVVTEDELDTKSREQALSKIQSFTDNKRRAEKFFEELLKQYTETNTSLSRYAPGLLSIVLRVLTTTALWKIFKTSSKETAYQKLYLLFSNVFEKALQDSRESAPEVVRIIADAFSDELQKSQKRVDQASEVNWSLPEERNIWPALPATDSGFIETPHILNSDVRKSLLGFDEVWKTGRSAQNQLESAFMRFIDKDDRIRWWYRNGENRSTDFSVSYLLSDGHSRKHFFPDFLVQLDSGELWIVDTKSTRLDSNDFDKLRALLERRTNDTAGLVLKSNYEITGVRVGFVVSANSEYSDFRFVQSIDDANLCGTQTARLPKITTLFDESF